MAKSKKKSGKLPKEIAGLKIPKGLRTTGDKVMDALRHPLIADIASAALLAAAAALRDTGEVQKASRKVKATADDAADGVVNLGSTLSAKTRKAAPKAKKKK